MKIRRARRDDLDTIMKIVEQSKRYMIEQGNAKQWDDNYPSLEIIEADIDANCGYVVVVNGGIAGYFYFSRDGEQPEYNEIQGEWLSDEPYGVLHRCVTGGARNGAGQAMLDWCFEQIGNIKIDTKAENIPMRKLLEKNGYVYCGEVYYEHASDDGKRMVFQKCE